MGLDDLLDNQQQLGTSSFYAIMYDKMKTLHNCIIHVHMMYVSGAKIL